MLCVFLVFLLTWFDIFAFKFVDLSGAISSVTYKTLLINLTSQIDGKTNFDCEEERIW